METEIFLLLDNVRSSLNVGSILRTADGLGVKEVFLCGYTPYPQMSNDQRLPHLAAKIGRRIKKTALGAETSQPWSYHPDGLSVVNRLKAQNVQVLGLEQTAKSINLTRFKTNRPVCLVIGSETEGVTQELLNACDELAEIPMHGKKESFNVAVAAGMALFYLKNMLN